MFEINGTESRLLATVGAFRVVSQSDLHDGREDTRRAQRHLEHEGLLRTCPYQELHPHVRIDIVSLGMYGAVDWTAPSLLVVARGPDGPARIVRAETSADRFLHQLTGE